MPEKPVPTLAYLVGCGLATAALLYVFNPTYSQDNDSASRQRIVGLYNPQNLCFCNSVLQALANSPSLRKYLIREVHRRNLDGPQVYQAQDSDVEGIGREAAIKRGRLNRLQEGLVTHALKAMLDQLNERPLQKKTVSAAPFIQALEVAFSTIVSRDQQDAQEFLHVVLERLCDEYHAGQTARRKYKARSNPELLIEGVDSQAKTGHAKEVIGQQADGAGQESDDCRIQEQKSADHEEEDADDGNEFSFEGQTESQIECQHCHFKPKPSKSTFVTLTLNVPHESSTTLNKCFDGVFKEEIIDDFCCDKCRLVYAQAYKKQEMNKTSEPTVVEQLQKELQMIEDALEQDPELELKEANIPKGAPKRTIKKSVRISRFPKVLAIHLSRSLFSAISFSTKNTAKVAFPDGLQVGGLLTPHNYRLSSVVLHKGGHNSGHYETCRRQDNPIPFSTPNSFGLHGVYSQHASPNLSATPVLSASPSLPPTSHRPSEDSASPHRMSIQSLDPSLLSSGPDTHRLRSSIDSRSSQSTQSSLSLSRRKRHSRPPTSDARENGPEAATTVFSDKASSILSVVPPGADGVKLQKRHKKLQSRWWRISDEKVKESKTSDVLSMQKEVYLLFYEAEP